MSELILRKIIRSDIPTKHTILYGILNWGLGHASRSVPIIDALHKEGHRVYVVCDQETHKWLQKERPDEKYLLLPDTGFRHYSSYLILNILGNFIPMLRHLYVNRISIDKLLKKTGAQIVISDNRFNFFSSKALINIYITHQTVIHHPIRFISRLLSAGHHFFISRYQQCWIFDDGEVRLAGKLSTLTNPDKQKYIGHYSRLTLEKDLKKTIDIVFLISGPEPQRTNFEKQIIFWSKNHPHLKICIIAGATKKAKHTMGFSHIKFIELADSTQLTDQLQRTKSIVCRPGYSTLMDLWDVKVPTLLIPTPGQTEQEYLSGYCASVFPHFSVSSQKQWENQMPEFLSKIELSHLVNP